jgi:hypothetical protein
VGTEAEAEEGVDDEAVPPALVSGDVGEGTGERYAKYELSTDGDRGYIAARIISRGSRGNKGQDDTPSGLELVSLTRSSRMLLMYISISSTIASDFRMGLTARGTRAAYHRIPLIEIEA